MAKLDVLMTNMEKMNQNISNMTKCNEKYDKFMKDKTCSGIQVAQDIKLLKVGVAHLLYFTCKY